MSTIIVYMLHATEREGPQKGLIN